ncbi:hypothetical protein UNSWDHB_1048 [Dehalobacter sp. UNSWDHB]|uniref:PIG-L deacetylase family protein n=1 Tax=Dehalobacter sp. UNSWDHB TaxID=1339256 RepID=UPI00038CA4AB|nr:PIG-L family deacetylase [Dehalobacter sp. UNSWDHB]EQB21635.1 hypothetical protein UNSWDHB_1048 [Dehalobacter sp. UNSWDHB]
MKRRHWILLLIIFIFITLAGVKWTLVNSGANQNNPVPSATDYSDVSSDNSADNSSDAPSDTSDMTDNTDRDVTDTAGQSNSSGFPSDNPSSTSEPSADTSVSDQAAIFYVPHPDDEVLNMGAAVLEAQNHNQPVVLVLLTKGAASGAFKEVNDRLAAYALPPITLTQFTEARVRDFYESARYLGIQTDNIYVNDLPDGQVTPASVREIILTFEAKYPQALHQAMSPSDTHPDHAASGTALRELQNENLISSCRYIISRPLWDLYPAANITRSVSQENMIRYQNALNAYYVWNPDAGRYSTGILSTSYNFGLAQKILEAHWTW